MPEQKSQETYRMHLVISEYIYLCLSTPICRLVKNLQGPKYTFLQQLLYTQIEFFEDFTKIRFFFFFVNFDQKTAIWVKKKKFTKFS